MRVPNCHLASDGQREWHAAGLLHHYESCVYDRNDPTIHTNLPGWTCLAGRFAL